jgi:hypothetical protein
MGTKRESLATFRASALWAGAADVRIGLSTDDAVAVADEMSSEEFRHHEITIGGALVPTDEVVASYKAARAIEEPKDLEARLAWLKVVSEAADNFWHAFEGQVVDGVEIIRKR